MVRHGMRAFLLAGLCVYTSACTTNRFKEPIYAFQTSTNALQTAFTDSKKRLADDATALVELRWAASGKPLTGSADCGFQYSETPRTGAATDTAPKCVVSSGSAGSDAPHPAFALTDPKVVAMDAPFAAIAAYGNKLAALTSADDRSAMDKAFGGVVDALKTLDTAVSKIQPDFKTTAPVIEQGASLLAQAASLVIDSKRLDMLRFAVERAKPILVVLAPPATEALRALQQGQAMTASEFVEFRLRQFQAPAVGRLSPADYEAAVKQLNADVQALNTVYALDPGEAVAALLAAHDKLYEAVEADKPDLEQLVQTMADFATKAKNLYDALNPGEKP